MKFKNDLPNVSGNFFLSFKKKQVVPWPSRSKLSRALFAVLQQMNGLKGKK